MLVWGDCGEIAHLQEGDRELAPVGGARLPLLLEHADLGLERCVRVGWVEHKRGREEASEHGGQRGIARRVSMASKGAERRRVSMADKGAQRDEQGRREERGQGQG